MENNNNQQEIQLEKQSQQLQEQTQQQQQPMSKSQDTASIKADIGRYAFIMAICALMIGIYHVSFAKKAQPGIAVIDITDVVTAKQKEFTALLTKKGATDADRGAAYEMIRAFGPQLEKSINDVQKDCNCTLVSKQAVLAGNLDDKTADLKARMGVK